MGSLLLGQRKAASIKMSMWHEEINEVMYQVKITKKWKQAGKMLTKMQLPLADSDQKAKQKKRGAALSNSASRNASSSTTAFRLSKSIPSLALSKSVSKSGGAFDESGPIE